METRITIMGPQGPTGSTGATGATGATGPAGSVPGVYNFNDHGGVPDWNGTTGTDNLAAWNALLALAASGSPTDRGIKIIADGHYYFSDTAHIRRQVALEGITQSDENKKPGTMFVFAANKTGIRIHSAAAGDDPTSTSGYSSVKDLTVWCSNKQTTGHAVHSSTVCYLENVLGVNFAQNGLEINADTSETTGNAAASRVIGCRWGSNGGHGVHVRGGDANVITFIGGESVVNDGFGVYDESGLGCTYVSYHCEGNLGKGQTGSISNGSPTLDMTNTPTGYPLLAIGNVIAIAGVTGTFTVTNVVGSTVTLNGNADATVTDAAVTFADGENHDFATPVGLTGASAFIGCYSEAAINFVNHPSQILGGILSEQPNIGDCHVNNAGTIKGRPITFRNTKGAVPIETFVGDTGTDLKAFSITANDADYYSWQYNATTKVWTWICDGSAEYQVFQVPTPSGNPRVRAGILRNGLVVGTSRAAPSDGDIYVSSGPSAPDATWTAPSNWEIGDRVYDRAPTAGGTEGWVCTVAGSAGALTGITADTTNGSPTVVVNDYTGIDIGSYITIVGVTGTKKVIDRSGLTLTVDSNCDATVSAAAVSNVLPTFKAFGTIAV